tara:strand:+ start:2703 stop:3560 length:858 start_codon:yes stop_codon:yes gene_type:complete
MSKINKYKVRKNTCLKELVEESKKNEKGKNAHLIVAVRKYFKSPEIFWKKVSALDKCKDLNKQLPHLKTTPSALQKIHNKIKNELYDVRFCSYEYKEAFYKFSKKNLQECKECKRQVNAFQINTLRTWKENLICDTCWADTNKEKERQILWEETNKNYPCKCKICNFEAKYRGMGERFHFDHKNIFDKGDTIYCMINRGDDWNKINKELSKCDRLCKECHDIVTHIEKTLPFCRDKSLLTRQLNNDEITQEIYDKKTKKLEELYNQKLPQIYKFAREIKNTKYIN